MPNRTDAFVQFPPPESPLHSPGRVTLLVDMPLLADATIVAQLENRIRTVVQRWNEERAS